MTRSIEDNFADIQGHILTPFRPKRVTYLFLSIDDGAAFAQVLKGSLIDALTSEAQVRQADGGGAPLERALVLGLTPSGLAKLNVRAELIGRLPEAFVAGMAERAALLGDGGASDPLHWERGFGTSSIDAVLCLLSRDPGGTDALAAFGDLPQGTSLITSATGEAIIDRAGDGRKEPFGFRDGISQPEVDLTSGPSRNGNGIAPGEFVLGYPDESEREAPHPLSPPDLADDLLLNGSYMVFRKIEQHLDRLDSWARSNGGEGIAAELVGRWKNGAVFTSPTQPPNPTRDDLARDFVFNGNAAHPLGSHIRRANPRDDFQPRRVRRHRLLRRGMPYAEGEARGVLFVCFNARIDDQFEFVQSQWLNSGNFKDLPSDEVDPIAGTRAGRPRGNGDPLDQVRSFTRADKSSIHDLPVLTKVRGGEYFLVPGRSALRKLADNAFVATRAAAAPIAPADRDLFVPSSNDVKAMMAADAVPRAIEGRDEKLYFVGRPDRVREVLADDTRFDVELYDQRIKALTDGGRLMVGMSSVHDQALRTSRQELLHSAFGTFEAPKDPADVARVAAIAAAVLEPLAKTKGPLDFVGGIARAIPLAVLGHYLGIVPPATEEPSKAALAYYFGQPMTQAWVAGLTAELRAAGRVGIFNLASWIRVLFLETFANWYEIPELHGLAKLAIVELNQHLSALASAPIPDTVFARALATAAAPADAHLLLLEMTVGGTETTAKAIANVADVLLSNPLAMKAARDAVLGDAADDVLDGIIHECLRFQPVAGMLMRRCPVGGGQLGTVALDAGARVCEMTAVASHHPAVFPDGSVFNAGRPREAYLTFGAGPHACAGVWLAMLQVRQVLRWLLGRDAAGAVRFPHVRRAAGPLGRKKESTYLPDSLFIRLD